MGIPAREVAGTAPRVRRHLRCDLPDDREGHPQDAFIPRSKTQAGCPLRRWLRLGGRACLHRQRCDADHHARRCAPAGGGERHRLHPGAGAPHVPEGPADPGRTLGGKGQLPWQRTDGAHARRHRRRQHRQGDLPAGAAVRHEAAGLRPERAAGGCFIARREHGGQGHAAEAIRLHIRQYAAGRADTRADRRARVRADEALGVFHQYRPRAGGSGSRAD